MDETKTIELKEPVEFGKKTYDRLELKEPTALQMVQAQKEGMRNGGLASDIVLIAQVSGVPKTAVEMMPISVVMEAARFLAVFTEAPATGSDS
jgi:hypothetical protein